MINKDLHFLLTQILNINKNNPFANPENLKESNKSENVLAKSWGHLVGKSAGNDHAVRLPGAGPKDDSESIEVVASGAGVHHFDGATGKPEGHRPDGPLPSPVHQIVNLRDHILARLRQTRRWR